MSNLMKAGTRLVLILLIFSVVFSQNVKACDFSINEFDNYEKADFILKNVDYYFTIDSSENIDWFYIDIDKKVNMEITLNSVIGFFNLNLEIYNEKGYLIKSYYNLNEAAKKPEVLISSQGRYYLKVYNSIQNETETQSDDKQGTSYNEYQGEVNPVPAYLLEVITTPF